MKRIDQETLSAFLDGELGELEQRRVRAALAEDAALRRELDGLARVDAWLRRGLEPAAHTAPLAAANAAPRAPARAAARARWPRAALAAGIAGLVLGFGGGRLLPEAERDAPVESAVAEALERHPSGSALRFADRGGSLEGEVVPVRTFRSAEGRWCREYEMTLRERSQELRRLAIACREDDGRWRTRLALEDA